MAIAFAQLLVVSPILKPESAQAAGWCQCTTFVANYKGLPASYPNAGDWDSWLPSVGHPLDNYINNGDILVLEPNVNGAGSLGHVGIVMTSSDQGGGYWNITMRSANWAGGSSAGTVANCTNVTDYNFTIRVGPGSGVSFFL